MSAASVVLALLPILLGSPNHHQTPPSAQGVSPLPNGVHAVWDVDRAWRESTPTRERICLNGLWNWQPSRSTVEAIPSAGWGWFKTPGCWPGIGDYMQKDCQTVYRNEAWKNLDMGGVTVAWYQREFNVPDAWKGRRISISADYVNSLAVVFVDGQRVGSISFPCGDLDVSSHVKAGGKHRLTMQVVALPLKAVIASYSDTNAAKEMRATVQRRGLCGDVFLGAAPTHTRLSDVRIETSVQRWTVTVRGEIAGADPSRDYRLVARIRENGRTIKTIQSGDLVPTGADSGRVSFTAAWSPQKLWDLNTPQNQYDAEISLLDRSGKVLDVQTPRRFGFRELWIDGRDFVLNRSRIFWSCVPFDNAAVSAGLASYEGAKESFLRLKSFGINMVYTHNYDCNPGSYLAFDEILRAADDVGMLVALTMPHFGDYDWSAPDADASNGYARHAAFFARVAANHPSVIAYATSHNATGYNEDTNPDKIDGFEYKRDSWALNNMNKALRAEAIIAGLDPSRLVYHHSSGSLGTMHTVNFYLNWAPIQELDDWFEHWGTVGIKPAFMVEFGVPFSWDWAMYRGWYKGVRSFGSAQVPWEYCMAEWNAQFLGDRAYRVSDAEKANLRWEAPMFESHREWYRWDYPYPMGSTDPGFEDQQQVWAMYTTDNWRAFRTWGVSGISPWETYGTFWRLKPGVKRGRVELTTDWNSLQKPGYSPDYVDGRFERRDTAFAESDWEPTTGGKSLLRNNRPLLGYIGGKSGEFTEKGHNFRAGERVAKELIVVNNSRTSVTCRCTWSLDLPVKLTGTARLDLQTGKIDRFPIAMALPADMKPGIYRLSADFEFLERESQHDEFTIHVLATPTPSTDKVRIAAYDPKGDTFATLTRLGYSVSKVQSASGLAGFDLLVIGKNALTPDSPGIDLSAVPKGLKVILFEQTGETLEQRFGFRIQEYGLRNVFPRIADHPALAGLDTDSLRDWRGDATVIPPRLSFVLADKFNGVPAVVRSGMLLPRVWRCGCRGSVASVLIEKPAIGDFRPIVDGGFSLQYSPLMEYREGQGLIVFCQMDVCGRTEPDPAADRLAANLIKYVSAWKPGPSRELLYAGDQSGRAQLEHAGFTVTDYAGKIDARHVLVAGPGSGTDLARYRDAISKDLSEDGHLLGIGLDGDDLRHILPTPAEASYREYIESAFEPMPLSSPFAGVADADVFNRAPRKIPVLAPGPGVEPGGVLASLNNGRAILMQLVPWSFTQAQQNTKRVFRHTSFALTRVLANLGVSANTPLLERFARPVDLSKKEQRWLSGFYLDVPAEEDDPYRFFGW
ncbi:MAG: hypothetical protein P4L46_25125 [Fimbriimonas sp.]|nr:hypothetical protein [Fimbriimonas sp.]